ncbi:MAG: putative DNA modification/repair radical SAM protein, partial [Shimia sp.]
CVYDCRYCINRVSNDVPRARFTVDEVVDLTIGFYRRNYIEGLFLSSGIIKSPDDTMADMVRIVRTLRERERFRGYVHLKTIPDTAPELIDEAGKWADRLSINVELPTQGGLDRLAPEKDLGQIRKAMAGVRLRREASRERTHRGRAKTRFASAGQSTQMIVGADGSDDRTILTQSEGLYANYGLARVYYSGFSPIPDSSEALPLRAPPLLREHRLYQADWLLRYYGFDAREVASDGMLDLDVDPKTAWALAHRERFPVDVNRACREDLLRVPGFGTKSVDRMLKARRHGRLRYDHLAPMGAVLKNARPFMVCDGWTPRGLTDAADLRARYAPPPEQLSLI